MRAAWMMSVFPRLTETFVLYEILAAERQGLDVDVYPLRRGRERVVHAEAEGLLSRARVIPFLSPGVVASQLYWLLHAPGRYLRALGSVLRGTWGSANYFFGGLAIFPKVAHAARSMVADGVQHVHCHFANHPALAGFVIHRLTGIPFSFTAHAHDLYVDKHMLVEKVDEAAFVVAISAYNRDQILEHSAPEASDKVVLLHCGVETDLFRPRENGEYSARLEVLCIARRAASKGIEHLVAACRSLAEQGVDFRCRIVGESGSVVRRTMQSGGLEDKVELLGSRTRAEVVSLLRESDVLVSSSVRTSSGRQEGIPVVLMEAMASGLPVVATRISGVPELVEDGTSGFLVAPGDPTALADALQRLAKDPALRRRMGAAGRERVVRDFDLDTNVTELVNMIRRGATDVA